jgi:hypothetical protein
MIESQRDCKDPSQVFLSHSIRISIPEALEQFQALKDSMEKLQGMRALGFGEVLVPNMYYDIPRSSKNID